MESRRRKRRKKNFFDNFINWLGNGGKARRIAVIVAVILLVTGGVASAWYFRLSDMEQLFPEVTWPGDDDNTDPSVDVGSAFQNSKTINIALLGFDNNEERSEERLKGYTGLVDTIMVAAINIETGAVDIVSIPRDSYVPIYNRGGGKDKINAANYYGWRLGVPDVDDPVQAGIKSQVETISAVLGGVPIHHYITVDMDAVIEIVNIMGGVWLDVPERTYHKYGRIIAEPGYQWFSGRRFLDYVRSRVAEGGDKARADKQQKVLLEAFTQFKQADKLIKAPQVLASVRKNVFTSLSVEQIMALALFGTQKVDPQEVTRHILEGAYEFGRTHEGSASNVYYLLNQKKRVELVEDVWGVTPDLWKTDYLLPPLPEDDADPSAEPDPADIPSDPGQPSDPEQEPTKPEDLPSDPADFGSNP